MTERADKSARELLTLIDDIEVDLALRSLERLVKVRERNPKYLDRKPFARYFLVIDLIRRFGSAPTSIPQLQALSAVIEKLLIQAFPDARERSSVPLPHFPSLGIEGVNIFHVIALYTANDPDKAGAFFTAAKKAGLASRTHLRSQCGESESTALHIAAGVGNKTAIDFILRNDAGQLMMSNGESLTAGEIAGANGFGGIAAMLRDKEQDHLKKKALGSAATAVYNEQLSARPSSEGTPVAELRELSRGDAFNRMVELLRAGKNLTPEAIEAPAAKKKRSPIRQDPRLNPQTETPPSTPPLPGQSDSGDAADAPPVDPPSGPTSGDDRTLDEELEALPPPVLPISAPERDATKHEIVALRMFVKVVCERLPNGSVMREAYTDFLQRLGISRLDKLKSSVSNPVLSAKFPLWIRKAIEESIDEYIREAKLAH